MKVGRVSKDDLPHGAVGVEFEWGPAIHRVDGPTVVGAIGPTVQRQLCELSHIGAIDGSVILSVSPTEQALEQQIERLESELATLRTGEIVRLKSELRAQTKRAERAEENEDTFRIILEELLIDGYISLTEPDDRGVVDN